MPDFHGREPEHQAWKSAVLAGELQLDEIDTEPYNLVTNQTPASKLKDKGISPAEAAVAAPLPPSPNLTERSLRRDGAGRRRDGSRRRALYPRPS